ncbi:MAG: peptidoglycan DD-metalloendopeptidase family protein [Candidatus Taylorbacteria bacterium]
MKLRLRTILFGLSIFSIGFGMTLRVPEAGAQNIDQLKQKIEESNATIQKLEQEIGQYRTQVEAVGKEAKTLQSSVKTLDITQQKLVTDIKVTENKIDSASLTIEKVNLEIGNTEKEIKGSLASLGTILRNINENDESSLLESFLSHSEMSEFWNDVEGMSKLQAEVRNKMAILKSLKSELEAKRELSQKTKNDLADFKEDLGDRKKIVDVSKNEKSTLLKATQNKESNYKKILDEKIALKTAFEQELLQFESDLKIAIDPNSYVKAGKGILAWPLDVIKITQNFGNTAFAQSGAYNGQGHNGVDFGAPVGTPVKSAGDGVVLGVGDTDLVCPGASYGKWILIQHGNGLSTLYGHLSLIKSTIGQEVKVGNVIGYTGNTGYTTGPHLHFTVYASQGVKILEKKSAVCNGTYTMPIADLKAYLNPLSYL